MNPNRTLLVALLGAGLSISASAQVGAPLPKVEFHGFSQTTAESMDDFEGRLILLENFAHW